MNMRNKLPVILLSFACFLLIVTLVIISPFEKNDENPSVSSTDESSYVPETEIYDDIISDPITDGMPDGVSYKTVSTTLITDKANGSRIVEIYPEFEGYKGINNDTDINYLIKLHREDMMRAYGEGLYKDVGTQTQVIYQIDGFDITYADEKFISIVYYGFNSVIGGNVNVDTGKKEFKCSLNIDIQNMRILKSYELISEFYTLKSIFCDGKMKLEGDFDLSIGITHAEMFSQYSNQYKIYPDVYFTEDNIMIIISLTPDIAGCAVYSYSINDAKQFLKKDLLAIKDLFS